MLRSTDCDIPHPAGAAARRTGLLLAGLLLAWPAVAAAEDERRTVPTRIDRIATEAPDSRSLAQDIGVTSDGDKAYLTLEQMIALALERDLTIMLQRYQRSLSLLSVMRNKGIYDLQLTATLSDSSETRPTGSALEDTDLLVIDNARGNLSLSQLTPYGGVARLDFFNSHNDTTDQFTSPNPSYGVDLDLTVTQPLLRNLGRAATTRNLIVARTNTAVSREDFQAQVEQIVRQAADGYWNLVAAREQLEVAEESLALAENLHEMNRIQVRVGTMAPHEMVQSEAGVAARKEDIILFRTQVEDAADTLRELVNLERQALAWGLEIVPVTDPAVEHRPVDVEQAVETAYESRLDIRRQQLQCEILDLDARVARNLKLPRLDLTATYGYNALAGDVQGDDGVTLPGSYSDALEQIKNGDFEGWRVQLQLAYPLQNRDARGRSTQARLSWEQGELALRQLELRVRTDVRRTARALEAAAERIETAGVSSDLARRQLEGEEKRYANGLSSSFEVLRIQDDLSRAQRREVTAIVNYRRAETDFYRSIGQLLDRFDIELAEDG